MRKITCINSEKNISMTFDEYFSPFLLLEAEGLYTVKNKLNVIDNSMVDGATINGSLMEKRNIILTLADKALHAKRRQDLYKLFSKDEKGTLVYVDDDGSYPIEMEIDYCVESIDFTSIKRVRKGTVSLLCADPYFHGINDIVVDMAAWNKNFEFIHEFKMEELGYFTAEKIKAIDNNSMDDVPLTISIYADGDVTNPSIRHIEKREIISVGTNDAPLQMVKGDELIITTGLNDKNVYLNGKKINYLLKDDTTFFNLQSGVNTLYYDATVGANLMQVRISYREKYLGA